MTARDVSDREEFRITADELGVLHLCESYGDGLELSAPRISGRVKEAARYLVGAGYLTSMKAASLTARGRAALTASQAEQEKRG